MTIPTINQVLTALTNLNFKIFDTEPNLIGIRSATHKSNEFNDMMVVIWKQPRVVSLEIESMTTLVKQQQLNKWLFTGILGQPLAEDNLMGANTIHAYEHYKQTRGDWRMITYPMTTISGRDGLATPMNPKGTAILKPGQYVNAYKLGFHRGKPEHPALVQSGNVTVWRDNDKDYIPEQGNEDVGRFGINIHRAQSVGTTGYVGKYSYGCQVAQNVEDHKRMVKLCRNYKERGIENFTYTLLTQAQLP